MTCEAGTKAVTCRSKMHRGLKHSFQMMREVEWLELSCRQIPNRYEHLVRS
jgi:hypothetical protein